MGAAVGATVEVGEGLVVLVGSGEGLIVAVGIAATAGGLVGVGVGEGSVEAVATAVGVGAWVRATVVAVGGCTGVADVVEVVSSPQAIRGSAATQSRANARTASLRTWKSLFAIETKN